MQHKNVLGGPLEQCCTAPMTGFHRDGYCRVSGLDFGNHSVCAQVCLCPPLAAALREHTRMALAWARPLTLAPALQMTQEFLEYTATQGNDLSSVVKEGEKWCLCAGR